jgi:enoyl-[acyl-carrier protein] reductase II
MTANRICSLFGIRYPLVQAGMVWCSPWQLAAAVSNAGGLGVIGAASMHPETLAEHIRKCREATERPFGVNLPLLYPDIAAQIAVILSADVPVVFTSAGNPATHTAGFKAAGRKVVHVVSSVRFARKAEAAGVDAVVAEGFEAGGHNGREETTTLCLVPQVARSVSVPVLAAGGIATGRAMLAAMALGAEGVQIGSRFVASLESSAHPDFKARVVAAGEGDTRLMLKALTPVRLLRNKFSAAVAAAENAGAGEAQLRDLLGRGRAKKGMFEGQLDEGELEIGQVAAQIDQVLPAARIVAEILAEFRETLESMRNPGFAQFLA